MACSPSSSPADRSIVQRIDGLRAALRRTVTVGISGVDCAGKSTLARTLAAELRDRGVPVLVIEGDELTRPTRERYADQPVRIVTEAELARETSTRRSRSSPA